MFSRMCLQNPPPRTTCHTSPFKPAVSLRSSVAFWTNQLAGPWMGFQGLAEVGKGALPSLSYLLERSLVIQLPPKQVQLLLLEFLFAAYHMYHHAAIHTSIWGCSLWREDSHCRHRTPGLPEAYWVGSGSLTGPREPTSGQCSTAACNSASTESISSVTAEGTQALSLAGNAGVSTFLALIDSRSYPDSCPDWGHSQLCALVLPPVPSGTHCPGRQGAGLPCHLQGSALPELGSSRFRSWLSLRQRASPLEVAAVTPTFVGPARRALGAHSPYEARVATLA